MTTDKTRASLEARQAAERELLSAWERHLGAKVRLAETRAELRAAIERAESLGVPKAEAARLFGISRQAVQEFFRGGRKK